MAERVVMIALSPTMEDGTILNWSKKPGDSVSTGDVICEVETDKASMDYESAQEGTLLRILVKEGDRATVGQTIAILGESGEDTASLEQEIAAEAGGAASGADANLEANDAQPEKSAAEQNASEGNKSGDTALPARESGSGDQKPESEERTEYTVPAPQGQAAPAATAATEPSVGASGDGWVKSSPLARKLANERSIDIARVPGSGPGGRVVRRDVDNYRGAPSAARLQTGAGAGGGGVSATRVAPGEDQVIPVSGIRGVIARRMVTSKFGAPHYYVKLDLEMGPFMAARKALNAELPQKLSVNAMLMKFVAEALKRHPVVNSSWQEDHILQYGSQDIGLAVDAGRGLITPIVRNCGGRGMADIDAELQELIELARTGGLKPEQYQGATFTISSLGSFGVDEFTAIINAPGSAILAVGRIRPTPVFDDAGNVRRADLMTLTLSSDHRVIDGAEAARFMQTLKRMMEEPIRTLV